MRIRFLLKSALLGFVALAMSSQADAQTTFNFDFLGAGGEADAPIALGPTFTGFDDGGANQLTLTFGDIFANEVSADGTTATGDTVAADAFADLGGGLGVNNPTATDAQSDDLFGTNGEDGRLNGGESISFSFDEDVIFSVIDFNFIGGTELGIATIPTLDDSPFSFANGTTGDIFVDPFGEGAVITAGTDITFSSSNTDAASVNATTYGVASFSVTATGVAVPEPSSLALLGLGGFAFAARRRRS